MGEGLPGSLLPCPSAMGPRRLMPRREGDWHQSPPEGTPSTSHGEPSLLLQSLGTGGEQGRVRGSGTTADLPIPGLRGTEAAG